MSLQSMTATLTLSRPRGVRLFTLPLMVALAVAALHDGAATDMRDAVATYAAAR